MNDPTMNSHKRILVVEDDPMVAALLTDVLTLHGHLVDTVSDGLLALQKIHERPYDLIMSDMRMPGLDGPGLYRELARHRPELISRFLFVSGTTHDAENRRFLEETGAPCLAKPFDIRDLHDVTQRMLRAADGAPEPLSLADAPSRLR
jgi:DNA-binding response OmpR family regulator